MIKRILNIPNLLFVLIFASFLLPSKYAVEMRSGLKSPLIFAIVLILIEVLFHFNYSKAKKRRAALDITSFVYAFLLIWEFFVSRLNLLPYIFIPAPENVFYVFLSDWDTILIGFVNSMILILIGMVSALFVATLLGTFVGWNERLTKAVYPVSKAISTVPALIYTPYIVLIMPTFRVASFCVIFLSIFWGAFMGSINNTAFVEKKIINSARILNLSTPTILFKVIIPFNMPRLINALPIQLATALMTLTVAEMLGADSGMGYYVRFSLNFANYTKAIAGIIFIGLVVTLLNTGIDIAKKHLIKWNY
ncbi:ABC transporter permease [Treponema sp.]|uniref:ABC transporter permease n=1 Tax=Treponema sp. TaxID=166 RepID=UPI00388F3822